jgi:hypothetical protein
VAAADGRKPDSEPVSALEQGQSAGKLVAPADRLEIDVDVSVGSSGVVVLRLLSHAAPFMGSYASGPMRL